MIYTCPYNEGITTLAIELIRKGPEWLKHSLQKYESYASIFEALYQILVNHREIEPIEKLSQADKERYRNIALGFEATKEKRLKIAKAYYLFEKIN